MSAQQEHMRVEADGGKRHLRIVPEPTAGATNVEHCRLDGDMVALFLERA